MSGKQREKKATPEMRGVFCNRTLNLKAIKAIGYDMDYTLVHYRVKEWEERSYAHLKAKHLDHGLPCEELRFDPDFILRGLIADTELGNLIKINRFGYVKQAYHGTSPLDFETMRRCYGRTIVETGTPRFVFMNTLFTVSEGWMWAQLVDLRDQEKLPPGGLSYAELFRLNKSFLDEAHMEGKLKDEVLADPERFVVLDAEIPLTLLDQKAAGKKLLLITNSEWSYTRQLLAYALERFLPNGMSWRDLFDVVIVRARKPHFFDSKSPLFEVVTDDGLLKPCSGKMNAESSYLGGNATLVEQHLGIPGEEILYVGDHIFSDIHVSKSIHRWRTALVIRELEAELSAVAEFGERQQRLSALMAEKERLEVELGKVRLSLVRIRQAYAPPILTFDEQTLRRMAADLTDRLSSLDDVIAPLAQKASSINNPRFGLLMRAGNDKSFFAMQVEEFADIYMSRVSNLVPLTPQAYFRSRRGSLPHDP